MEYYIVNLRDLKAKAFDRIAEMALADEFNEEEVRDAVMLLDLFIVTIKEKGSLYGGTVNGTV